MRPSRSLRRARRRAPSRSSSRFHPRGLSLSLPLDIVPPLFPPRTFSLFQPLVSSRSLIRVRPMPYPLGLLSRSSLLPSPFPFVSARPPLLSRVVVPLSKPLFPPRYITTLPRLVRSSSNSPPARRLATARIFALFSLAPSIPSDAPSPSLFVPKLLSIFLSFSLPHLASLFPRPLFRSPRVFSFSDQRFFARRLCIVWRLVCGTYIIQARGCVRVRPGRPSRARLAPRGDARVRIASIRVHGEKKMGGCIVGACHRGV